MYCHSYEGLQKWKEIMWRLPKHNQLDAECMPEEVIWDWDGNKIHVDYYKNSKSKMKLIVLHGVGGNGRLLSFIGAPIYKQGVEVIIPDLPGYGVSYIPKGRVSYPMWVKLVNDLIDYELKKDDRPIVLFGLSAGGMLAYQAACKNKKVAGLIFTNLLDQRIPEVREHSAIHPLVGRYGIPMLKVFAKAFPKLKVPMRLVANMGDIVNDKDYLKVLVSDKRSSGAAVSIEFITTLAEASPEIEPEDFDLCPVLLVHPAEDRWTPVEISRMSFDKLKCQKELVMLENAGHYPIEDPGLTQLEDSIMEFLKRSSQ